MIRESAAGARGVTSDREPPRPGEGVGERRFSSPANLAVASARLTPLPRLRPPPGRRRSAAPWSWTRTRQPRAPPGWPASPPTSPACAGAGREVIVVSSGAIALARRTLRPDPEAPEAGGKAGRRRGRPDPPRAGLERGAVRPGPHRRAAAADAGRHRGSPPLPQRPRHAEHPAGARLHPGDQRERHRRHRGNPLRRQRPPRRAGGRDDAGRRAGAAVRHRRPLHRRSAPRSGDGASTFPVVAAMTPEIEAMGGEPPPGYSSGGMRTKLVAARIATQAGCAMAIAHGYTERPLTALADGARCTWFLPAPEGRSARKRWIAGSLAPLGDADRGCRRRAGVARRDGRCCRPACGRWRARFQRGDPVVVAGPDGTALARGLSAYASARRRSGSPATAPMRSRRSWAGAAATRSSIATIWCCLARAFPPCVGITPALSLRGARAEAISCLTSRVTLVRQEIASARAPRNDSLFRRFPLTVKAL